MRENAFLAKRLLPEMHKEEGPRKAVQKYERAENDRTPKSPEQVADIYMERLENVFLNEDERVRERNIKLLKPKLHEAFVLDRNDFPESYFELQKRILRERGQAVEEIPVADRERMIDTILEDQKVKLDEWVDYLASDDAGYPAWFKYFAFRNITKLSQFDKERGEFKKRTKSTTASFPEIDREALARACDTYENLATGSLASFESPEAREAFVKEKFGSDKAFKEFAGKKFGDIYAAEMVRSIESAQERGAGTAGQWRRFEQGDMTQADALYESLQGKGTGWCTAGKSTAEGQVRRGDFHVYYTYTDKQEEDAGTPSQPRIAIRMEGKNIGEVRGVLPGQELEPIFDEVLEKKLGEFGPEADAYRKKVVDMKRLTRLDRAAAKGEPFSAEDLTFLYELDSPIQGFGYGHQRDPRIVELRGKRNAEADARTMLDLYDEDGQVEAIAKNPRIFLEHPSAIAGIDQQKIADALLTARGSYGPEALAQNIDKLPDLDHQEMAVRICEVHPYAVIDNIDKFTGVDEEKIVSLLFENGRYQTLALAAGSLKHIDRVALGRRLLAAGQAWEVASRPDNFEGLPVNEILESVHGGEEEKLDFITRHQRTFLGHLDELEGIDPNKVAALLERDGDTRALLEHIDEFPDFDKVAFARRLLATGNRNRLQDMRDLVRSFGPLPLDIALEYFDATRQTNYIRDYNAFLHLDPNVVIAHALEKDPEDFVDYLRQYGTYAMDQWHGIDEHTMKRLIDAGASEHMLSQHQSMFEPRAERALYERIKGENALHRGNYLPVSNFETLTLDERVALLKQNSLEVGEFARALNGEQGRRGGLMGLDARIASELIKLGQDYVVTRRISHFQPAEHNAIARELMKTRAGAAMVLNDYDDFKNLSVPVLRRLRSLAKENEYLTEKIDNQMREREPNAVRRFLTRF